MSEVNSLDSIIFKYRDKLTSAESKQQFYAQPYE